VEGVTHIDAKDIGPGQEQRADLRLCSACRP